MQHACKSEFAVAEKVVNISLGPLGFRARTAKTSSDTTDSGEPVCVYLNVENE